MPQALNRNNRQTNNPSGNTDYGSSEQYIQKADYDLTIESIEGRLDALEKRVGNHASLAASFKEAFEKDKDVDKTLTALLSDLLQKDELRKALSDAVGKADRQWLIARLKSVWGFVVGVVLILIGALADHFLHNGK